MDSARSRKAKITKEYNKTLENMRAVGTYKKEFEAPVRRYAELRIQYDVLMDKWYKDGCEITEKYTNKFGAVNERKTTLYAALESIRRELTDMENIFGLTPKGLRAIKTKALDAKKESALDRALSKMDG